ncbi:hypothetical protein ACPV51_22250, partial [Vibrio astriarenae]
LIAASSLYQVILAELSISRLVQAIDISNGPFARPDLNVLLSGVAFIRNPENNYPIRGSYL